MLQIFIFFIASVGLFFLIRPFAEKVFTSFPDRGWGMGPTLAIISLSYFTWWLNHLPMIYLSHGLVWFAVMTSIGLQLYFIGRRCWFKNLAPNSLQLFNAVLWLCVFAAYLMLRQVSPNILGIEKFPDFMILNSVAFGGQVPPQNLFASDQVVNYYYFGHYMAAVFSKLTFLPANWCFHLFMAYCLASSAAALSSLAMAIVGTKSFLQSQPLKTQKPILIVTGLITFLFTLVIGNFHTFYHLVILKVDKFWYPDATRYIEKTIHEFPYYSILIGDLHGHVMNIPNVILSLSLIFIILKKLADLDFNKASVLQVIKQNSLYFALLCLSFGASFATNSWDIMSTMLFAGFSCWAALCFKNRTWGTQTLSALFVLSLVFVVGAMISFLPFWVQFKPPAQGIGLVPATESSHFLQLLIIWIIHILIPILFLLNPHKLITKTRDEEVTFAYLKVLSLLSIALIVFLEIFYFKDIYSGHIRANSLFKIGLFAWIGLSISSVCLFSIAVFSTAYKRSFQVVFLIVFGFLFGSGLIYSVKATLQYVQVQSSLKGSLDGLDFLRKNHPDDFEAIQWLQKNIHKQTPLVSAPAKSFEDQSHINIFSGLPTLHTWETHNWLWHGSLDQDMKPRSAFAKRNNKADTLIQRRADTMVIYTSPDKQLTLDILNLYKALYILISPHERKTYENLNESKWADISDVVFSNKSVKILKIKDSVLK